jgi:hypothetical protein
MADSSIVIIIISICCLVSISLVAGGYFYYKQLPVEDTDTDPSTMSQPTMTSTTTSNIATTIKPTTTSNIATTIKPTTTSNTTTTIKPTSTSNTTTTPVAKPSAWKSYCTTYCSSKDVKSYTYDTCVSKCTPTICPDCDYTGPYEKPVTTTTTTTTTPVVKPSAWKSYCTTYCPSENVKSYAKCDSYCNKTNCTDCDYTGPYVSS